MILFCHINNIFKCINSLIDMVINMDKRVQIVLLGFMIYLFRFFAGGIAFAASLTVAQVLGLELFAATIGLALALFLIFRDNGQDYQRTGLEAGITWYVILVVLELILITVFNDLIFNFELWYPSILFHFKVFIIPILVGYLLAESKSKV